MTDADDLKQMYSQAIAERQRQQDAHGNALIDAAIEAGLLPKTDVLTPEIAYYLAKSEEIRQNNLDNGINGLSLPDLELAWEWAQVRYQRFLAEQAQGKTLPPESGPDVPGVAGQGAEGEEPKLEKQIATTAAHHGVGVGRTQKQAAELMGTSDRTYRKYRDKQWFLSERDFHKQTGKSIADYWKERTGGK